MHGSEQISRAARAGGRCAVPSSWRLMREMASASRLEIVEVCERFIPCQMSNIHSINRVCGLVEMGSLIWGCVDADA